MNVEPNLSWQATPGGRLACFLSLLAWRGCTLRTAKITVQELMKR
jgi:hypothetical protein